MARIARWALMAAACVTACAVGAEDKANCDPAMGAIDASCPQVTAERKAADLAEKARKATEVLEAQMDTALQVACTPDGAWLHIGPGGEMPDGDVPAKTVRVNWSALIRLGPPRNSFGDRNRSGSAVSRVRCGPLEVQISAGYLNTNPQGELGVIEFPVVTIAQAANIVLPNTAMSDCEVSLSRYSYFGKCPDSWARSITAVKHRKTGELRLTVERAFVDSDYQYQLRTDTVRVPNSTADADAQGARGSP